MLIGVCSCADAHGSRHVCKSGTGKGRDTGTSSARGVPATDLLSGDVCATEQGRQAVGAGTAGCWLQRAYAHGSFFFAATLHAATHAASMDKACEHLPGTCITHECCLVGSICIIFVP